MSEKKRRLFPVPVDIINKLIEQCSGECQCELPVAVPNRKCHGCKKIVCNNCEMYWMKCPQYGNEFCIHLSGNRYCYGCVRTWRKEGTECIVCEQRPTFFLV